ncbi:MAG: FeoA domain-containing protein [Flammeovirgaceae bacterium]
MSSQLAVVVNINGKPSFKSLLLSHGIVEGTAFAFNYSPKYSGLVNITINNRMISIRANEFQQIDWEWKK